VADGEETAHVDGPVVVALSGDIDVAAKTPTSGSIGEGTQAALADDVDLVVDLTGVTFMDSAGFSALVRSHNRLADGGHAVTVRGAAPAIRRAMDILGLSDLVEA
jgi:anti-sigma B factor antagonist